MLSDKQIPYKKKTIRANSVKPKDVIEIEGRSVVVLEVHKEFFRDHCPEESVALLQQIEEAGAKDKISANFDEFTVIDYAFADFTESGAPRISRASAYFAEWEYVDTFK